MRPKQGGLGYYWRIPQVHKPNRQTIEGFCLHTYFRTAPELLPENAPRLSKRRTGSSQTYYMKKYQIIYADPPWSYKNGGVPQGGVNAQYKTMSLEDIKALPVKDISADTSVLLLWATFPQLQEALEVMKAWGFEYKTLGFSWLKTNKDGSPFFGIGYYAKSNMEACLLGVRGNAHSLVKSNSVSSVILHPKTQHSRKPDVVREKIVELFGDLPRIELFARNKGDKNLFGENPLDGWDAFGNEVESDIELAHPKLI